MSMTDPISDFLTRIRNGIRANKDQVECPKSRLKVSIAEILQQEGYVASFAERQTANKQGAVSVTLRYTKDHGAAIRGMRRVSRPGQRKYVGADGIPTVRNGLGIAILSTSQGLLTDKQARAKGVGGEVLCEVW